MHDFAESSQRQATLERLIERGLAVRLERRPGQKEERYAQLLGGDAGQQAVPEPLAGPAPSAAPAGGQLEELRERIARLEREMADLHAAMRHPC